MTNAIAASHLRQLIERVERLTEDKKALETDIREVFAEAKGQGFNIKVMKQIIRERAMDANDRAEFIAIHGLYATALGMESYDDTPLGRSAPAKPRKPAEPPVESPAPAAVPHPGVNVPAARAMGLKAGQDGQHISDNPFLANDPRRAAWDEGWCAGSGEDGMGIPAHLRRPGTGTAGDAGSAGEAPA